MLLIFLFNQINPSTRPKLGDYFYLYLTPHPTRGYVTFTLDLDVNMSPMLTENTANCIFFDHPSALSASEGSGSGTEEVVAGAGDTSKE